MNEFDMTSVDTSEHPPSLVGRWLKKISPLFDILLVCMPPIIGGLAVMALCRLHKIRLVDLGFIRQKSLFKTFAMGILTALGLQIFMRFMVMPVVDHFTPRISAASTLGIEVGDWTGWAQWALFMILSAGFGEEIVWRGYLMRRIASFFKEKRYRWQYSLCITSLTFGVLHFYLGLSGVIHASLVGFGIGYLYLKQARNLWLVIIAHATYDLMSLTLIVSGFNRLIENVVPWIN